MLQIVEQEPRHEAAVQAFNERLKAGGSDMQFPVLAESDSPRPAGARNFVAVDGEHVRGGYILTRQDALMEGEPATIQLVQLPLSEGIVDQKFAILGFLLVKDAIGRGTLLYGLGMGGLDMRLPKMFKVLGFRLHPVPFWFRVLNAAAFLRNIQPLRTTPFRRLALDALSHIPLVPRALTLFQASKATAGEREARSVSIKTVPRFGPWADDLWRECSGSYSLIAIRDAGTLNQRLPPDDERLHRIKVERYGQLRGWVVVTDTRFDGHKQFGSMRVGTVVDALCLPGEEGATVAAAVRFLRQRGVELMVSNQCAAIWNRALALNGFLPSASNFIFAASPQLAALVARKDPGFERVQMNRCDGDGPIHL